jgi:hypothetical protein
MRNLTVVDGVETRESNKHSLSDNDCYSEAESLEESYPQDKFGNVNKKRATASQNDDARDQFLVAADRARVLQ